MDVPILEKGADLSRYVPLSNFVLLKRIDQGTELSEGGMVIPDIAQVQSNKGKVLAVGDGYIVGDKLMKIPLEPGDVVLFSKYGAEEIRLDGEDFLLLRYDEIKLRERRVLG